MAGRIKRRDDVNPERGEHEYGDVKFADPTNNKYPIDTAEHVRAAWSYINHADNAAKYSRMRSRRSRNASSEPPRSMASRSARIDGHSRNPSTGVKP